MLLLLSVLIDVVIAINLAKSRAHYCGNALVAHSNVATLSEFINLISVK